MVGTGTSVVAAARTLLIALAGALAAMALGLPVPYLSGAAIATSGAAIAGLDLKLPLVLREATLIFLGVTIGSAITPATLALMMKWPLTLAVLALCVVVMMNITARYLAYVHGYDRATARLSAIPGALPFVLALAAESNGDAQRVAITQMVRILILIIILPSLLTALGAAAGTPALASITAPVDLLELAVLLAAGVGTMVLFRICRAPAPSLFGPMMAGALLYGSGALTSGIPATLLLAGYVVIGAVAGSNFAGVDRRIFFSAMLGGIGSVVIGGSIAIGFAGAAGWLLDLPVAQLWLAYAPGGSDTMAIMALALGLDPAFVAGHHVARFIGLGFLVPYWMRGHLRSASQRQATPAPPSR